MIIYNYHPTTKVFVSQGKADQSPLEPGVFLFPANCTQIPVLPAPPGKQAVFKGNRWEIEDAPIELSDIPPIQPQQPKQLSEIKKEVWDLIKQERDRRKAAGFPVSLGVSDVWFHSDADSRIQYIGLKDIARDILAEEGEISSPIKINNTQVRWKALGGRYVDLTVDLVFKIVDGLIKLDAQLFAVAESHRASMESSEDPLNYPYLAGWPKTIDEVTA